MGFLYRNRNWPDDLWPGTLWPVPPQLIIFGHRYERLTGTCEFRWAGLRVSALPNNDWSGWTWIADVEDGGKEAIVHSKAITPEGALIDLLEKVRCRKRLRECLRKAGVPGA